MVDKVGLIARGKDFLPIPLESISIKANVYGILAHFEASLVYKNSTPDPIEVEFKHPLYNESTLIGIEAIIDGKKIRGIVKEKAEAKTEYEDAIASGSTAVLVEEYSQDILGILLGNLAPGKSCTVTLQLLQQLDVQTEGIHLLLPTTLKPRYELAVAQLQPSYSQQPVNEISVSAIYKFCFEIFLVGEIGELKQITSPSHKLTEFIATDGCKGMHITSSDPLNVDLVVYIDFRNIKPLSALIEPPLPEREQHPARHPYLDNPAALLTFMPKSDGTELSENGEFVFIIDRSGSMSGGPIKEACETLDMLVRSLSLGCYFNIIGFGSSYVSLFPHSVEYSQLRLNEAVKHISTLTADLGGTEILQPLQHVYSVMPKPGLSRQIFLLTDGGVSNIDQVIDTVAANSPNTRVFTFGIGSGVSTELVNKVARAGRGKAVFISSKDRMQSRVMEVMNTAMSPSFTNISITGTKSMVVYPECIPVLFENEPFVAVGFFNEKIVKGEKISVTLKYSSQTETKAVTINFSLLDNVSHYFPHLPNQLVHQFGVSQALKQLEDTVVSKDECITLSSYSNIMCKHTSYVAVGQDTHQIIAGSMKVYNIRNDYMSIDSLRSTRGCAYSPLHAQIDLSYLGSDGGDFLNCDYGTIELGSSIPDRKSRALQLDKVRRGGRGGRGGRDGSVNIETSELESYSFSIQDTKIQSPGHQDIMKLQKVEGFWDHSKKLEDMLGCKDVKKSCPKYINDLSVWMTVLCLSYLQQHFQTYKSEWLLVCKKGEKWVKAKMTNSKLSYEQVFDLATDFLKI